MFLLASVLNVADGQAHSWQRVAPGQWWPDRMLFLQGEPFLRVLVLVDSGYAAFQLRDAPGVAEVHVMRDRGQVGVRQPDVVTPNAILHLVGLLMLAGRGQPRRAGVELGDRVPVVELRVTGNIVMPRVALAGVLYRQDVQVRAAVVLRVPGRSIRLGRRGPGLLEAMRLFHLFCGLQHQVYSVGALVVHTTTAHRL